MRAINKTLLKRKRNNTIGPRQANLVSPMRAAKVQASLRIRAVSPEPPLLAHTSSESRGTFIQKARSLAPLNGWACAVKICHNGMLENTNSLDAVQLLQHKKATLHQRQQLLPLVACGAVTKDNNYYLWSRVVLSPKTTIINFGRVWCCHQRQQLLPLVACGAVTKDNNYYLWSRVVLSPKTTIITFGHVWCCHQRQLRQKKKSTALLTIFILHCTFYLSIH